MPVGGAEGFLDDGVVNSPWAVDLAGLKAPVADTLHPVTCVERVHGKGRRI
jgi:hypothetical protein